MGGQERKRSDELLGRSAPAAEAQPQGVNGFTHICLDCGKLGVRGGCHDHGESNAGDTIALTDLPGLLRSFHDIERDRDELHDALTSIYERLSAHRERLSSQQARDAFWDAAEALGRGVRGDA